MNISFLHFSIIIFQHHILHESLHHQAYAFNILFILQTAYLLFSCLLMHDPCIFLCKTKKQKGKHENSRCILSCIYSVPWANHVGIINPFQLKTKWLNMVPNAGLTKKRCFFGHLNCIITFSMHSIRIPESFVSMKCCRSIGDQIVILWIMGLNQAHVFTERFIKSSWSMEVNILQKLGQKMDRVTSLLRLLPNTFRIVDILITSSFTLTKMSWTMLKIYIDSTPCPA